MPIGMSSARATSSYVMSAQATSSSTSRSPGDSSARARASPACCAATLASTWSAYGSMTSSTPVRTSAVEPELHPAVPFDEPGGDAVQPRAGVRLARVVAVAAPEGRQEGVGDHVVGQGRAQPPSDVAAERGRVPVEEVGEDLRLAFRAPYQGRVIGPDGFYGDHTHCSRPARLLSTAFARTAVESSRYGM